MRLAIWYNTNMNNTATYIAARIARQIADNYDQETWLKRKPDIIQVLTDLSPSEPDDEIPGFLAYDVQGHDRMKMRTGRFLTRKLKLNSGLLPDTAIQAIAAQINTKLFGDTANEVRLDSGQRITENYENNVGGNSCMTGDEARFTGLYADNPDKIKQLVMRSVNDSARAIVHVLDNGMCHMSRVYATSEDLKKRMRDYARGKGWYYRRGGSTYLNGDIISDYTPLVVSDLSYTDSEIPFADSLTGYRITSEGLTLTHSANGYDGILDSTCGELTSGYECSCCGESASEEDIYTENDEYYCCNCYHEHFAYCECCESTRANDDCAYVESAEKSICSGCLERYYTRCEDCSEWFTNDDVYSVDNNDKNICIGCLDSYSCCDNCGDYFSDVEQADNGSYLCEDCLEDSKVTVKTTPIKDCGGQKLLPTL